VRRRHGVRSGRRESRLDFLANLFGAFGGGSGAVELKVIVDVPKESRIILLAKIDDGEPALLVYS